MRMLKWYCQNYFQSLKIKMKFIFLFLFLTGSVYATDNRQNSYGNYYFSYTPKLTVLIGINKNDEVFKKATTYKEFVSKTKEQVNKLIKKYTLKLDLDVIEEASFQDYNIAAHDYSNVGIIAINHGSQPMGPFAGDLYDANGVSLFSSFNSSDPNIRAIALVSCYSNAVVNSWKALNAFAPFTYLISYTRPTFDVFDIEDATKSVIKQLKETESAWLSSRIINNEKKVSIKLNRVCEDARSQGMAELEIYFDSTLIGNVKSARCNEQQIIIDISSKLVSRDSVSYVEFRKKHQNDINPIGKLESSEPLNSLNAVKDSNGNILGGEISNLYTFKRKL